MVRIQLALRVGLGCPRGVEELAGQRPDQLRVAAADPAQPDDAERCAAQFEAEHRARVPARPATLAKEVLCLARATRRGQCQAERDLGGGVGEYSRRVRDHHAALAARREVDVVVSDSEVRDHSQCFSRGVQQVGAYRHRRVGDDRRAPGREFAQLLRRDVQPALAKLEALSLQEVPARGQQDPADQYGNVGLFAHVSQATVNP